MAVLGGGIATAIVSLLLWPREEVAHIHGAGNIGDWLFALSTLAALGFALIAFERHRALVHARRAEQSFRDLYENVGEGVFRRTPGGGLVAANPALVRLHGYDNEEALIRGSRDGAGKWYVDPGRNAEIQRSLLAEGHVTNVVSEAFRMKTGERIWIEESLQLVRDEKTGEPIFYDGLVREVTDAKQRTELQERYDKIASLISGYLLQLRGKPDGTFCLPYASIGLYRMFGIRPEDVVEDSTAYRKLIHPDDVARVGTEIRRSRDNLSPFECEYRARLADGSEKWVLAHCVPEREADGSTLWHGYVIDISEKKRSEERVYELAYFDSLTHLPNRSLLRDRLRAALAREDGAARHGAMLFVDLDNFKVLNDTKGHHVGDMLLCEIARRICGCVGADDLVARLGGDEFIVLLEDIGADAKAAAKRVRKVGKHILAAIDQPFTVDESCFQTTASIGAVVFSGSDRDAEEVLKHADLAMYEAKAAGRATLCFFQDEMQIAAANRLALASDLRQASKDGRFLLHFQPIVDSGCRCIGAEALLRWNHPTRGLINASEFIGLSESGGFMGSIDSWVLEEACATLKRWEQDPRTRDLKLAVNVSAHEMNRLGFVDFVERTLAASGVRGDRLTLEITEHVMLDSIETVTIVMQKLQAMGIHFAIDDFGTGYSSLSYLKRLPIDTLKIDRSFVSDIESDLSDREIVQTILNIARSLKVSVIAEGVETELQALLLRQLGCHAFQGYLFAKPLPQDGFFAYLDAEAEALSEADKARTAGHLQAK